MRTTCFTSQGGCSDRRAGFVFLLLLAATLVSAPGCRRSTPELGTPELATPEPIEPGRTTVGVEGSDVAAAPEDAAQPTATGTTDGVNGSINASPNVEIVNRPFPKLNPAHWKTDPQLEAAAAAAQAVELTTTDLTPHGLPLLIDLPAGVTASKRYLGVTIQEADHAFSFDIRLGRIDTEACRAMYAATQNYESQPPLIAEAQLLLMPGVGYGKKQYHLVLVGTYGNWDYHAITNQNWPSAKDLPTALLIQRMLSTVRPAAEFRPIDSVAALEELGLLVERTPEGAVRAVSSLNTQAKLTDSMLAAAAGDQEIEKLTCRLSCITDDALPHIGRLTSLKLLNLNVDRNQTRHGVMGRGLTHLAGLAQLKKLSIRGGCYAQPLTGLEILSRLPQLRSLELTDYVDDEALKEVGKLAQLQSLSLNGSRITDDGLSHLAGLEKLEVLSLRKTAITDGAVEHLIRLKQLRKLDVSGTKIGADGRRRLEQELPDVKLGSASLFIF